MEGGTDQISSPGGTAQATAPAPLPVLTAPAGILGTLNDRAIVFLVYGVTGLVLFPMALAAHLHLMADGSHFLLQMLYERMVSATGQAPARMIGHYLTQWPAVLALKSGADIPLVSRIYGAGLYYVPWVCYVLATMLFFRAKMPAQALLVTTLYSILAAFTSLFIISESHLSAALFVLTIAVIQTSDLRRISALLALLVLGALGCSIYEFWAAFFPAAGVLLLVRAWRRGHSVVSILLVGVILIVYAGGTVLNIHSMSAPNLAMNRKAMFNEHLIGVMPQFISSVLLFALAAINALFRTPGEAGLGAVSGRIGRWCRRLNCKEAWVIAGVLVLGSGVWMTAFGNFVAGEHYGLRSLNLALPMMFAGSFLVVPMMGWMQRSRLGKPNPKAYALARPERFLSCAMLGFLGFATFSYVYRIPEWKTFRQTIVQTAQTPGGYIPVNEVQGLDYRFGWTWCYPTMSILFQAIEEKPVTGIVYFPGMDWEPLGPHERRIAELVCRKLGLKYVVGGEG